MDMWKRVSVFAAGTSGQKASKLEIEPTGVNEPADRKHHIDPLPIQSATLILIAGKTLL